MVVLRKQANVRILDGIFIYPGINGNVPESIMKNESFQDEVKHGIMEIISQTNHGEVQQSKIDEPDLGTISAILKSKTGEAIKLVRNTLKLATILELEKQETRPAVLTEITEQKKALS